MQDSYHQMMKKSVLPYILISVPIITWLVCLLLPTFDDWTYVTSPYFGHPFAPERMFVFYNKWRPIDALYGSFLGLYPKLFPTLNHILVCAAHTINTIVVYKLAKLLKFNHLAINIATVFFYISPAVLGTVYGVDSMNQAFALLWGLTGLYVYWTKQGKIKYLLWISTVVIAAFTKENGLMWAFITPVLSYGLNIIDKKQFKKDITIGISVIILYIIARISLPTELYDPDSGYFDISIIRKVKNIILFVAYPWLCIDFVSIIYPPERNIFIIIITLLLSLPFMGLLFCGMLKLMKQRTYIFLVFCVILAALPHLLTVFSTMHSYAAHALWALLMAYIINSFKRKKIILMTFIMYCLSATIVDIHHWQTSYQSGLMGKRITMQAIKKTHKKPKRIFLINIDRHQPKYSSFCVKPIDAFAWGLPVRYYTDYTWPNDIEDTEIVAEEKSRINEVADSAIQAGFQCVWLLDGENINVIR